LELTQSVPGKDVLARWLGENIRAVFIPTSIFLTNKRGFPVLSKQHQHVLFKLFEVIYFD
jgi:protein arginine N-methyltransferase 5